jgi:hypothetical protein
MELGWKGAVYQVTLIHFEAILWMLLRRKQMTTSVQKLPNKEARFTPNMDNYRTSLAYEGLALKKNSEHKSIADLKRKYAR